VTWKGFSPVCTSWWRRNLELSMKALPHSAQTCTRGPCVWRCLRIDELSRNSFVQPYTQAYRHTHRQTGRHTDTSDGQISNQILHAKSQIFKHQISNLYIKSQSQIFKNTQIPNLLTPKSQILVKPCISLWTRAQNTWRVSIWTLLCRYNVAKSQFTFDSNKVLC